MDRLTSIFALAIVALVNVAPGQTTAPYGVNTLIRDQSVIVYWFYPAVNETTLAMVDDEPQSYLLYGTADAGARLASVFDLPNGLCAIQAVEIRLWPDDPFPRLPGDESSPFGLVVDTVLGADTTAMPIWRRENLLSSPGPTGWQAFSIKRQVSSDVVVVEFKWQVGTPTAPLPAVSFSSHFVNSYIGAINNGVLEWSEVYDAVALMRVQINLADIETPRSVGESAPDSFSVFVFDSPDEIDSGEPMIVTVCDSLHVVLDHKSAEGKLAAVAAWQDDVMSQKSEIVRIDAATNIEEWVLPSEISALSQNYPNPFNSWTVMFSDLAGDLMIYDVLGREVCRLSAKNREGNGAFRFEWDGNSSSGSTLPSGVYFYRQAGSSDVKKLILLK